MLGFLSFEYCHGNSGIEALKTCSEPNQTLKGLVPVFGTIPNLDSALNCIRDATGTGNCYEMHCLTSAGKSDSPDQYKSQNENWTYSQIEYFKTHKIDIKFA